MRIILKRKSFTQWDQTDNLKRMKDSDILAEKKKPTGNWGQVARNTASAAAIGGTAGLVAGGAKGLFTKGGNMAKSAGKWGKRGALVGGLVAGGLTYAKGRKQANENAFYNQRLEYAKNQALRREKKDWKTNMTQRDGYSY